MQPGSLVELVDDNWPEWVYQNLSFGMIDTLPVKGPTYTVREIVRKDNGVSLLLEEIVNPKPKGVGEVTFAASRFRELLPSFNIAELMEERETVT